MDAPRFTVPAELLLEHAAWVRQLAFELVREPAAADDLAQETWLAFLRARPDTRRPLRPWLAQVARNAARLSARRGAGRRAQEAAAARPERVPDAHELVERAEAQQRLARAVLDLDEPYRTALLLRYYEGLGPARIARAQGIPAVTVRSHLHRGLERLRRRLDDEHGGDRKAWVVMLQPILCSPGPASAGAFGLAALLAVGLGLALLGRSLFGGSLFGGSLFGARESDEATVVLEAPLGTRAVEGERAAKGPAAQPPARAPAVAATERALHLIDSKSRPLGDYAVRAGGRMWRSDAAGVLLLPNYVRALEPIDDERLAVDERVGHRRRALRSLGREPVPVATAADALLMLPAGPTLRLEIVVPARIDLARLQARLISLASSEADASAAPVQLAPLRPADERAGLPWVRFGEATVAPARIELRDDEGLWSGSSVIAAFGPGAPELVRIELEQRSVLEGRVDGIAAGRHAGVELILMDADQKLANASAPDERGGYALRWVVPGEYVLHAYSSLHLPWSSSIELQPGERRVRDLELLPTPSAGLVAGVVTSASNRHDGQLLVFLTDAGGATIDVFPTTWRADADGRRSAGFRFEHAPPGALRLDVLSLADAVSFRASPASFEAPFEELRVTLEDQRPAADWVFDVYDATSGSQIEVYELEVRIDGGSPRRFRRERAEESAAQAGAPPNWTLMAGGLRWNRFESEAPLRGLSVDVELEWTLLADGYAPLRGDAAAFDLGDRGERRVTLRLRRE